MRWFLLEILKGVDEILGDFHPIQARACVGQDVHAHAV